jgi:hypothetical protein
VCHAQLSENGVILCDLPKPHGARGDIYVGNISTVGRVRSFGKL